jgi:hypothetical protein
MAEGVAALGWNSANGNPPRRLLRECNQRIGLHYSFNRNTISAQYLGRLNFHDVDSLSRVWSLRESHGRWKQYCLTAHRDPQS